MAAAESLWLFSREYIGLWAKVRKFSAFRSGQLRNSGASGPCGTAARAPYFTGGRNARCRGSGLGNVA